MTAAIPEQYRDLFAKRAFAHLATVMPKGGPQLTPVWCDLQGGLIRVNSAKGRVKDSNMRRDARVALCLQDPDNAYRYLEVRGRVAEVTEQGAEAHIDALAKKYIGKDQYPFRQPGEVRVIYKIAPERFSFMG